MNTALIILAAGESSRLGRAKQLLSFDGKTLLQHTIDAGRNSKCRPLILILGFKQAEILNAIDSSDLQILSNQKWQSGMASSISAGVKLLHDSYADSVASAIIANCDQPFLSSQHLDRLIEKFNTAGCSIVASSYAGITGSPALFSSKHFTALMKLEGQSGARTIVKQNQDEARAVAYPEAAFDIDTEEDWLKFLASCKTRS